MLTERVAALRALLARVLAHDAALDQQFSTTLLLQLAVPKFEQAYA